MQVVVELIPYPKRKPRNLTGLSKVVARVLPNLIFNLGQSKYPALTCSAPIRYPTKSQEKEDQRPSLINLRFG
jgi:hypothetical protein